MTISFLYPSGRRVFGAVLAVGSDFIRVDAPRRTNGLNLYLRDQDWVTEAGRTVRVECIFLVDGVSQPSPVVRKRSLASPRKLKAAGAGAAGSWSDSD